MKKLIVKDPFLFGEWFDIYWFHGCHLSGLAQTIRERLGYGLSWVVAEQEGNVHRNYFSRSEWTTIGRRYLEEVLQRPIILEQLLYDLREAAAELMIFSETLEKKPSSQLSTKKQIELLQEYHKRHHHLWALGQVPNVLELENTFLTDYLKGWLAEQNISVEEQTKAFQALITPRELSGTQQAEREILQLAAQKDVAPQIKEHWQKFKWLQFGWIGPALTLEYFIEVHRGLYKEGKAKQMLEKLLEQSSQLLKDKQYWKKKLTMPPKIEKLFRLLEELLFIKAYRMDALFMSYAAVQPLLKKIAQDHYLSLQQVYVLYCDWLIEMLESDTFDVDYINQLGAYSVRYFDGMSIQFLLGEEARTVVAPIKQKLPPPAIVNELKGECAFPGKVSGRVCIVNQAAEMDKFKDGDILVSNVTDPSLLPIMKKAWAFVTNMGGLTCHAAIVARELQVPCVIGTKVATHVLKDGDIVEVDATSGMVKKL